MTREQIEKAAKEYAEENPWYLGETFHESDIREIEEKITDAFRIGAQWRINAVWHKPSAYGEELKRGVEVIAKTKRGYRFGKFDVVGYSDEYIGFVSTSSLEYALSDVLEYAYLSDLVPERKEETE